MRRGIRSEQRQVAVGLRDEGRTWTEVADVLRFRWPELSPRAAIRIAHGWSQKDAAREWNTLCEPDEKRKEAKDISGWERWPVGGRRPSLTTLGRLAQVYGCSISYLLSDIDDHRHLDPASRHADRHPAQVGSLAPALGTSHGEDVELRHDPTSADLVTVAALRQQVFELDVRYESTPSTQLVGAAGQCLANITMLKRYAKGRIVRELLAAEAEAATLMGQLVWDAAQRREQSTARFYFQQARTAARHVHDPAAEGLALLRESFLSLYGEVDPRTGLALADQAATVGSQSSNAIAGLALLHVAEAHAMLQDRRACERALGQADVCLEQVDAADRAAEILSPTQPGRLAGSCYLSLGEPKRAQRVLEDTASSLPTLSKNKALVLGNLARAHIQQVRVDETAAVLQEAMDVLEQTRGAAGLNVVFDAGRELRPWHDVTAVRDVHERMMTLMTTP